MPSTAAQILPTKPMASTADQRFDVDARYTLEGRRLGQGAYGMVCAAFDTKARDRVAIKRIRNAFEECVSCKKALREIRLMRHFQSCGGHENILALRDMMISSGTADDLYLVFEMMDTDLFYIIRSRQIITDGHVQWFMYQLFRGLKAIHSAGVIHRDLKPSNLLINKNCDLKICDFGLARSAPSPQTESQQHLTEYVVTRWYRSPELIAQRQDYGTAVDIWSAGCILAECLSRDVLFKGKDYLHQLRLIIELLGTPSESELSSLGNPSAAEWIQRCPKRAATPLPSVFPTASPLALDLLARLLAFDPAQRPAAAGALAHPYLHELHQMNDAPDVGPIDGDSMERPRSESELRALIWAELQCFRPSVGPVPPSFAGGSPSRVMDMVQ